MVGTRNEVSIDGVRVSSSQVAGRGPLLVSTVDGRAPSGDGEILSAIRALHQVGAHLGSIVHVPSRSRGRYEHRLVSVVGTASFPKDFGLGGLGTGAALTFAGYLHALCPPGPAQTSCLSASVPMNSSSS